MSLLLAMLIQSADASPAQQALPDDVVVVVHRRKCDVAIASRIMSDREFRSRAKEWRAGRPVRVHVPLGSPVECEAQIMFRLNRYGVIRATFVDE